MTEPFVFPADRLSDDQYAGQACVVCGRPFDADLGDDQLARRPDGGYRGKLRFGVADAGPVYTCASLQCLSCPPWCQEEHKPTDRVKDAWHGGQPQRFVLMDDGWCLRVQPSLGVDDPDRTLDERKVVYDGAVLVKLGKEGTGETAILTVDEARAFALAVLDATFTIQHEMQRHPNQRVWTATGQQVVHRHRALPPERRRKAGTDAWDRLEP